MVEEGRQDVKDGGPGVDELLQFVSLEGEARDGRQEHRLHLAEREGGREGGREEKYASKLQALVKHIHVPGCSGAHRAVGEQISASG